MVTHESDQVAPWQDAQVDEIAGHIAPEPRSTAPAARPIKFDPQRRLVTPALRDIIVSFLADLEAEERRLKLRSRHRRPTDQAKFCTALEALVCNLLLTAMVSRKAVLSVPRAHAVMWGTGRYSNPVYGEHFLRLLDLLCKTGFILELAKGYRYSSLARQPTTVQPTHKFRKQFLKRRTPWTIFSQEEDTEVIVLRSRKDYGATAKQIDYRDTPTTKRWRREVIHINQCLRQASITLTLPGSDEIAFDRDGQPLETYRRCLRRVFNNGTWKHGGRLWGGFWMNMERSARFALLRVDGEPVANVDFGSLFARLTYARAHQRQPDSDLYDISGDGSCRDGWKHLMNALLFAEKPLKQWPRGIRELFSVGWSLKDAIAAIARRHALIAHLFGRGLGFALMRLESDMLVAVVTKLFEQGVTALPLHDSVLVAQSNAEITQRVMEDAFRNATGSRRAFVKIDCGSDERASLTPPLKGEVLRG